MRRILTKRRVAFVAAVGAAVALASTAAGAVRHGGSPRSPTPLRASGVGGWESTGSGGQQAADTAGVLTATASCVSANASRTMMTHSYNASLRAWVVHVARQLCSSLYVQDAAYRKPLQGGRDYPQRLYSKGPLVRMQRPGTYRVRLVARNNCLQTDTGASWGSPPRWPGILTGPGVPQPIQLSHWSRGPNTWFSAPPSRCKPFLPPPTPTATSKCPLDCTGIAVVTVSARNPVTYSGLQILPVLNGRRLTNHLLRLGPGRSGSVSFHARDGDTVTLLYVYPNTTHPPYKPVGRPLKVKCPPGAPPVTVTLNCPCAGDITGTVQVTNASRYALQVAVLVSGVQKAVVSVPAHQHGSVTLAMSRQATVTFGYRYNVTGHFPATFTRIAFKVTTSA